MYSWYPPNVLMISPRCTHSIPPMYSWYPPDVLNILRFSHGIPKCIMISPDVLNIPQCTHDILRCTHDTLQCTEHPWCTYGIPPMYWTPHDIPRCAHGIPPMYSWYPPMYSWYPPMYWTSPDVLNTHYTGWRPSYDLWPLGHFVCFTGLMHPPKL